MAERELLYPSRIICLTEETTEVLYLLGEQDRIVGISGFTQRPPEARKVKPKVSAFIDADIPAIEALKPDLILAFSDIQADITRELVKRGHNVYTFNQRSIAEILQAICLIGSLVGRQLDAEALVGRLQANLDRVREESRRLPKRPRVYFEEWPDPMISGIRWVSELVEIAGGADILEELSHGSLAKQRFVDPDVVLAADPDVIVASWCGKKVKHSQIVAREGWEQVKAIRSKHLYEIDSTVILQPGPASLTDGLDALARIVRAAALDEPLDLCDDITELLV